MNKAFTLVELSIVLVIIGLITGGVLGAQSLVESAKIQSAIKDIQNYEVAINAFDLEYGSLPGDFREATEYWGEDGQGCPMDDSPDGDGTCNGNGDKKIDTFGYLNGPEAGLLWQHLALSEIVNGSFKGRSGEDNSISSPEEDSPKGAFSDSYYGALYLDSNGVVNDNGVNAELISGHYMVIGSGVDLNGKSLSPKTTKSLDNKLDDGNPRKGRFLSLSYSTCVSSNSANATYNLSNKTIECNPYIRLNIKN